MSAAVPTPSLAQPGLWDVAPNAGYLSGSQVVRRSFRMAILFVVARLLGVEGFGAYVLLLTVVEIVAIASGYGYIDFLTREVAKRPKASWLLGSRATLLRLAYIPPGLGLALLSLKLLHFPSSTILNTALLAVTLLPRAAGESAQGLMKGLQRFSPLLWIEAAQGLVVLVAAPALVLRGFGIRGVIGAEVLGAIAGTVVSLCSIAGSLDLANSGTLCLRALLRSTFAFNVYPFIANIYDRVDVVLLSKLAGAFATGIYSLPYRAYATLQIIPNAMMGALLPMLSSSAVDRGALETCSRAIKFLYLTALLIVLVTLTFAGPAVLFFLGQSYAGSIVTIKILIWAAVPSFLNGPLNTILLARHKEKLFLWTASICTVFNVTANLMLIPRYSFIAAAAVTVMTECLLLAQNLYLVKKAMGHLILPRDLATITVVFGVVLAGFWVASQGRVPQLWAGTLACALFGVFTIWMTAGHRLVRVQPGHEGTK